MRDEDGEVLYEITPDFGLRRIQPKPKAGKKWKPPKRRKPTPLSTEEMRRRALAEVGIYW